MISEWNDLSNSGSAFCLEDSHQFSAQEKNGLKLLFEEFQDGCLVHGHL